jgi:hypothetical protein
MKRPNFEKVSIDDFHFVVKDLRIQAFARILPVWAVRRETIIPAHSGEMRSVCATYK